MDLNALYGFMYLLFYEEKEKSVCYYVCILRINGATEKRKADKH